MLILAATDLAPPADEAIRQADEWAVGVGAELAVSHIVGATATTFGEVAEKVSRRVVDLTGRRPGQFRIEIDRGRAGPALVDAAGVTGADLVVVGVGGTSGIQRLLRGGVSRYVVERARCRVLVARRHAKSGEIVVGTDLSDPSAPAILAGASEARRRRGRLTVVHDFDVWSRSTPPPSGPSSVTGIAYSPSQIESMLSARSKRLREWLDRLKVDAEPVVTQELPEVSVLETAKRLSAELVVVGTRGRTGLARLAFGSVADRIVEGAECSVLVVRLRARG